MSEHVVIIGNGVGGVTAARMIRKLSDRRITIISDESPHFFSRTALMYIYMGHMRFQDTKPYEDHFWAKNRIETIQDRVTSVDVSDQRLTLNSGMIVPYDRLVIATGSVPQVGPWRGVELEGVQGFYHLSDLRRLVEATPSMKRAVIIGGGLIGIELAEMLHSRRIHTRFLVREAHFMDHVFPAEESAMIEREIRRHDIDLRLDAHVAEIEGHDGRVAAVRTSDGERHPADFVGMAIGVRPNVDWLLDSEIEVSGGVLVTSRFETNIPNVFAVGDCAEFRSEGVGHRRIEQLWYTARRHGHALGRILCGADGAYDRGVYFNSAKFFTIEHQIYGAVGPVPLTEEETWYRQGEEDRSSVRINYERDSGRVGGFLAMGTRLRQDVCERWINGGATIDHVGDHFAEACFDPEFVRAGVLTEIT
jgi:3-phenylpropionate/trans-cinnamate dioxygenase ferredoxin reductase component